jgi:hypothetical protein
MPPSPSFSSMRYLLMTLPIIVIAVIQRSGAMPSFIKYALGGNGYASSFLKSEICNWKMPSAPEEVPILLQGLT